VTSRKRPPRSATGPKPLANRRLSLLLERQAHNFRVMRLALVLFAVLAAACAAPSTAAAPSAAAVSVSAATADEVTLDIPELL